MSVDAYLKFVVEVETVGSNVATLRIHPRTWKH